MTTTDKPTDVSGVALTTGLAWPESTRLADVTLLVRSGHGLNVSSDGLRQGCSDDVGKKVGIGSRRNDRQRITGVGCEGSRVPIQPHSDEKLANVVGVFSYG